MTRAVKVSEDPATAPVLGPSLLIVAGAKPPPDVIQSRDAGVVRLDLAAAELDRLQELADRSWERVTVVTPSLSHLRIAFPPLRLVGETAELVVRFTSDNPRVLRLLDFTDLSGSLDHFAWSHEAGYQSQLTVRTNRLIGVQRIARAVAGCTRSPLSVALRLGLRDRATEPYAPGLPHSRYVGVDDILHSGGKLVPLVDLTLQSTDDLPQCGVAPSEPGDRPLVRVLSPHPRGGGRLPDLPPDADLASVEASFVLPPVDTRVVNPTGFLPDASRPVGRCVAAASGSATAIVDDEGQDILRVAAGAPITTRQLRKLRQLQGVESTGQAHPDALAHARLVSQLAAAGIPLVLPDPDANLRHLLGPALCDVLAATAREQLGDPLRREAVSIRLRRAALSTRSTAAWSRQIAAAIGGSRTAPPLVSVMMVTRRPALLRKSLAQMTRQSWERMEIVLGLHSSDFDDADVKAAVSEATSPITVVRIPDHLSFGEALNEASAACSGAWITKWDDDDHYGSDHVLDLMLAADYSGATIVGKAPEFVLLDDLGIIVRRPAHRSERQVHSVAGGTLLLRRTLIDELGGWRPVSSAVDTNLLRQVLDAGGSIYRTHGFGYILVRHRHGHTWDPGLGYFLEGDTMQWRATPDFQDVVLEMAV